MSAVKWWLSELSFLLICGSMDWIQDISFDAVVFSYWAILQALLHSLIEYNLRDIALDIPVNYYQVQAPEWQGPATRASKDLKRPVEATTPLLIIGFRLQLMNKHWSIWSIKYTIQIKQWRLSQVLSFKIVNYVTLYKELLPPPRYDSYLFSCPISSLFTGFIANELLMPKANNKF